MTQSSLQGSGGELSRTPDGRPLAAVLEVRPQAVTLEEQHEIQQQIQKLEKQQRRQRQDIFKAEDEIMEMRDSLIESLERRLAQHTATEALFTIRWVVE